MAKLTCFILVAVLTFAVDAYKSYDGVFGCIEYGQEWYVLIEAIPRNKSDRQAVNYLQELDVELDFWLESPKAYRILVSPEKQKFVTEFLIRNGISVRIINDHIQSDLNKAMARLRRKVSFDYDDFNTLDKIVQELHSLAARCPAGVTCTVESIGKSVEGRDILLLKISKPGVNRKGVWIDATIHAREWLATATHLKITKHLIDDYSTDADVKSFVDKYDFYLLPVVNPDGYEFTWTAERYWRKNRSPNPGARCQGTDLNRNFDQKWGGPVGSSPLACSNGYHGVFPASEPETQALQKAAVQYGPTLATSVHIHTAGQMWLTPWGSVLDDGVTCNEPDDYQELLDVANKVADAIQNTYNTTWTRGSACTTIYPAVGLTMDYFKDIGGVKHTASPELRYIEDTQTEQIEQSFREVWNGLRVLFDEVA